MTVQCTFARASPDSLPRKPFNLDVEATPKTDLPLSGSLVHRQTWRLTGIRFVTAIVRNGKGSYRIRFVCKMFVTEKVRT